MKLYLLSDLHCEFAAFRPDAAVAVAADVVILAGDIDIGSAGIQWAAETFPGKPVVYVCGNHEFYGQHWEEALLEMRITAEKVGVFFLENNSVTLDGVRFLGAALWTDFCLYGQPRRDAAMDLFRKGLNDCRQISASTPVSPAAHLTPALVLERHHLSRHWLQAQLAKPFKGKTVVVTHHAPSSGSVAPRYRGDPLTPGFASDLPVEVLQGAALWVHGHMHDSSDYLVGTCRVTCNPRGYPLDRQHSHFENAQFNPSLLVEI